MAEEIEPQISRKFEIISKLGKGAYGIVWKAIDKKLKQVFDCLGKVRLWH